MIWRCAGVALVSMVMLAPQQVRDNAQPTLTGTAQISGTVSIAGHTPTPARRATVTITGELSRVRLTTVTEDTGAFAFAGLPADRYTVLATKGGYLPATYGSKRPGGSGTSVVLAAAGRATVAITIVRGGVLSGTVRDEYGRPLPNVLVSALRYMTSSQTGNQTLDSASIGSSGYMPDGSSGDSFPGTGMTDDRGVYRIWSLAAGQYIVSVQVRLPSGSLRSTTDVHQVSAADLQRAQQLLRNSASGVTIGSASGGPARADASRVDYAPVYYPGAVVAGDATPVALAQSEERSGIDVVVRLTPSVTVSGTVTGPDGSPLGATPVLLWDTAAERTLRLTQSDEDGVFVLRGVNPGRYLVQSYRYAEGLAGFVEVAVDGRDISTSLTLATGGRITGRVVFDGTTPPPPFTAVRLILRRRPFPVGSPGFEMKPDGQFVYSNVPRGTYQLYVNGPAPRGWMLRSVMVNGVDGSDIPFEVAQGANIENVVLTLTDRRAEITGMLQDASGKPAPEYVLIVYSADPRYWVPRTRRTQSVRPDINGTFIARDLPAGDYFVSAVTDIEDGQWNDPAFLAALAASAPVKVTLAEGEKKTQNIRVGGGASRRRASY